MSNYVANMVVCSKEFYYEYLYDTDPFGKGTPKEKKIHIHIFHSTKYIRVKAYMSMKRTMGNVSRMDFGLSAEFTENDHVIVKFQTRWHYPIQAIIGAISLDHSVEWNCIEEDIVYISKFCWKNGKVSELTLHIEDEYYELYSTLSEEQLDSYDDCDDLAWHMDFNHSGEWIEWETDDLVKRYHFNYSVQDFLLWRKRLKNESEN